MLYARRNLFWILFIQTKFVWINQIQNKKMTQKIFWIFFPNLFSQIYFSYFLRIIRKNFIKNNKKFEQQNKKNNIFLLKSGQKNIFGLILMILKKNVYVSQDSKKQINPKNIKCCRKYLYFLISSLATFIYGFIESSEIHFDHFVFYIIF